MGLKRFETKEEEMGPQLNSFIVRTFLYFEHLVYLTYNLVLLSHGKLLVP